MYQGNNPTALQSQQLLLDTFIHLLEQKKFKDISISEICCQSGVSRQTFYSLFKTKENLLLHQLQLTSREKKPNKHASKITLMESCQLFSEFIIEREKEVSLLIENDLMDILKLLIFQETETCKDSFIIISDQEAGLALDFMAAGLAQLAKSYLTYRKKPVQDELTQLAYKILSGSIYRNI
ncbi:TetR/AcrR family transcriptional regulator [Paenibacillus amylolyticus]|uniref:HTH tetR-type domain-containing protein n=1 Tax=Paenibacillus amylolyticus TaxID=1451 RepID=A0A124DXU0_PAEAM|nr:TetR/AcrR family transcriptional regulator [Paenibacillus amylolyticus]GAS82115.1 unknown protein [Paenibacillus amylolyticus]